jgi:1-acyl-sn-glycerol-3-phosphate acyltransferase
LNAPRWRLACLWLSQLARVLADNWLRIFVVLELARLWDNHADQAWYLVVLLWTLPMVVLAPFNGALSNSLPKPRVLVFSALVGLLAVLAAMLGVVPWILCWELVAVTFAVYGPTRYAFLPAAAQDTGLTLPQLNGLFEMGAAVATVAGVLFAGDFLLMGDDREGAFALISVTTVAVLALHAITLVFAVPVRFASDVSRPEHAWQAVRGFFTDCGRIWRKPRARGCLLGLAGLRAMILVFTGAVLQGQLFRGDESIASTDDLPTKVNQLAELGLWVGLGVAVGSYLASCVRHPVRSQGLVPWGTFGFAVTLGLFSLNVAVGRTLCLVLGVAYSFINVPLAATYQAGLPADARGNGMAARNFCDYIFSTLLIGIAFVLTKWAGWTPDNQLWLLTLLAGGMAVVSTRLLYRECVEMMAEIMLNPFYRISAEGPGVATFPLEGPVLVVANHCAWFDPIWLGKMLPRRFKPMMTSRFFDLPVLCWLVKNVAGAIRVEESRFRRDVPELAEAIAALDDGSVVMIFPEGGLRRREDQPLKFFGQGIWHILHERPTTPVVVCWIEGNWGSFFSHFNGPPTKNKRMDFRRPIRIGFSMPQIVPSEVLADQRGTRLYLMERCVQARQFLGLPVPVLERVRDAEPT